MDEEAKPAVTGFARSVAQRGKNIDWSRVRAAGAIIAGISMLHGVGRRRWRYFHTFGVVVGIVAGVAPVLMERFAGAERTPEDE
jgi:hypothetical protein